jgi:hypothetical protein
MKILMVSNMTYKDAQRNTRAKYEKLIDNDIKLEEFQHLMAGYFDKVKRKLNLK